MAVDEEAAARGASPDPFAEVPARNSTDYLLRNLHEQLSQLSAQADLKASIVLTVCTIVLSISFSRSHDVRASTWVLAGGLLCSLVAAILAVLPSIRARIPREEDVDLLFFAQFSQMPQDHYIAAMAKMMETDASVYRTVVGNLHSQGVYLMQHKYRYLRLSYIGLLATAGAAAATELAARVV